VSDAYSTPWGDTRDIFYNVTGIPDMVIDGLYSPGSWNNYDYWFEFRVGIPTDVTIDVALTGPVMEHTQFTATVCIEPGGVAKDMRIHMVNVLDHHPVAPTYYRNCVRYGAPFEDVSLAAGECVDVVRDITFDATSWNRKEEIKIIAFAQDPLPVWPAEVYQAAQIKDPMSTIFADGFESGDFSAWSAAVE